MSVEFESCYGDLTKMRFLLLLPNSSTLLAFSFHAANSANITLTCPDEQKKTQGELPMLCLWNPVKPMVTRSSSHGLMVCFPIGHLFPKLHAQPRLKSAIIERHASNSGDLLRAAKLQLGWVEWVLVFDEKQGINKQRSLFWLVQLPPTMEQLFEIMHIERRKRGMIDTVRWISWYCYTDFQTQLQFTVHEYALQGWKWWKLNVNRIRFELAFFSLFTICLSWCFFGQCGCWWSELDEDIASPYDLQVFCWGWLFHGKCLCHYLSRTTCQDM